MTIIVFERAFVKAEVVRLLRASGELQRGQLAHALVECAAIANETHIDQLLYSCRQAGIVECVRPGVYRLAPEVELVPFTPRYQQVADALESTPGLIARAIAQSLDVSTPIVYNQLRKLERTGDVRREGARPARWYLVEE